MIRPEWEDKVLSAIREVLSNPMGGKIDVFVMTTGFPGKRKIKTIPYINGRKRFEQEIDMVMPN